MNHLKAWEVIHIHDRNIAHYGGLPGLADKERVKAVLSRVESHELYEHETDVYRLAALYFLALARGHVFADSNKRTAFDTAMIFFERNGITPCMRNDLEAVILQAAAGAMTVQELAAYFSLAFSEQ